MKKEFIKMVKSTLDTQKQEIIERQANAIDIDLSGDEVDAIQGEILANIQSHLLERDRNKLKLIDGAFAKISEGSFGYCEECGEEISQKRLEFNPLFINCIGCAEQLEVEAKRNRKAL